MPSHDHVLSQLTFTKRVAKRAQYEALEFTVVPDGVRVRNASYTDPAEHEYIVTVRDGLPVACECPADEHYDGACKHRVAVAIRTPLLQAATEYSLVADGGAQLGDENDHEEGETEADQPPDCECDGLRSFPCWPCFRTGRRDFPEE